MSLNESKTNCRASIAICVLAFWIMPAQPPCWGSSGSQAASFHSRDHLTPVGLIAQANSDGLFFDNLMKVYMPRRMCMFEEQSVIWLHVLSDAAIALAYYSIPFALVYFVRRRRDVAFGSVFWMFAAFILACGTTHVFGVIDIWKPFYKVDGILKVITAALSIGTAIMLWRLMPRLLSIPSATQLEMTVRQRTAELEKANAELRSATEENARLLEAERTARTEAERQFRVFDTALSGIRDYTFIFDRESRFVYANKVLLELWGRSADQAIGKTMAELDYPPEVEMQVLGDLRRVFDTGGVVAGGTTYTSPAGARGYHEYILAPVLGVDGTVELVAGSSRDLTERKQAEAERERLLSSERAARAEAERASHLKDEFLATLSHELRTPLNAILGWSHLLRRTGRSAGELDEGLNVIERNARAQTQLVAELLDMSRIISGKLRLEVQSLDLGEVIGAAVLSVGPGAEAKGIRLEKRIESIPQPFRGDSDRIHQVIWNLLTNAIKFTPAGGSVVVTLARAENQARIVVSDTGLGIPSDFLPHVFERFRQLDGSTTRRHGGLGIGLSIVKSIVEAHGGIVTVTSPGIDRGTTFTVSLPLSIVHEGQATPLVSPSNSVSSDALAQPVSNEGALASLKVLVVDDDPDAVGVIATTLRDAGAQVITAHSAAEGFEMLQSERPDVLVSDIGMPDEDGYQFLRRVRALSHDRGGTIPAVAVTAFAGADDRRRALSAGFQSHISKPIEPQELITVVADLRAGATRR